MWCQPWAGDRAVTPDGLHSAVQANVDLLVFTKSANAGRAAISRRWSAGVAGFQGSPPLLCRVGAGHRRRPTSPLLGSTLNPA